MLAKVVVVGLAWEVPPDCFVDFLEDVPWSPDTLVSENGDNISVGPTSWAVLLTLLCAYSAAMELHGKMSEVTRKRPSALAEVRSLTRPIACRSAVVCCVHVFLFSFGLFLFFSFLVLWSRPVYVVCSRD